MKKNPRQFLLPFGIGRAIDRMRKEDERGILYFMDYKANYYTLEKFTAALTKSGCSSFLAKSSEGGYLFGRNYDFCHYKLNQKTTPEESTGLIVVVRTANPRAKYKTLGVIDGFWLDNAKGTLFEGVPSDGVTDLTRFAMAPFIIMDGINEVGLVTSIMHLPTENDWQEVEYRDPESLDEKEKEIALIFEESGKKPDRFDIKVKNHALAINTADHLTWKANKNLAVNQQEEGKATTLHPILMRKMLDYCANVEEAIAMAKTFNMKSPLPDNDYHIMLADRTGRSVILEWINQELQVIEAAYGTNFYLGREDRYGYGHDRYEILEKRFENSNENSNGNSNENSNELSNEMNSAEAMALLEKVAQNPFKKQFVGFTQWSGVYDLEKASLKLSVFLDYEKEYEYTIKN